jgi:hypothetical protein
MGFKPVTTNAVDIKGFENEPFEGVFLGSKDIETKIGPQVIYKFKKPKGGFFQVYGFTNLNRSMEMVEEGTLCRLTYKGTQLVDTKFGKKDVHQVLVETDSDYAYEHKPEDTTDPF